LVGNRTAKEHATASGSVKTLYTYNSWDQLVTEGVDDNNNDTLDDPSEVDRRYTYDENGSTTSVTSGPPGNHTVERYVWDLRNRMVGYDANGDNDTKDSGDANYAYDTEGNRIRKQVVGTGTTVYLVDPQNPTGYAKAIEEKSSATATPTRSYVFGHDIIAQSDTTNGTLYFLKDGHGTTRALTNGSEAVFERYDFDAYGNKVKFVDSSGADLSGSPITEWLDADGRRDAESNLDYHIARYRELRDGGFLSSDPGWESVSDTSSPGSLHHYRYTWNNPISSSDASGQFAEFGMGNLGSRGFKLPNISELVDADMFKSLSTLPGLNLADSAFALAGAQGAVLGIQLDAISRFAGDHFRDIQNGMKLQFGVLDFLDDYVYVNPMQLALGWVGARACFVKGVHSANRIFNPPA
jgi:hypothetical protein